MVPGEAVGNGRVPKMLKRLFSFEGRMGRLSYFGHSLLISASSLVIAFIMGAIGGIAVGPAAAIRSGRARRWACSRCS